MSEITLVKQQPLALNDPESAVMRRVLFELIGGLGEQNASRWRRFWNWIKRAEVGEVFQIETWTPRQGVFHRKHMALESAVFQSQEKIGEFEAFRTWLKVGAGFVDWIPGPKGGVIPVPKSISYAKLDEHGMQEFHAAAVRFLRTAHAQKVLWRHLSPADRSEMMELILGEFGE